MRVPWGGRLFPGCGASRGGARSHHRPLVRSGVRPGPTTHWLWVRGLRAWGPVTKPHSAHCCVLAWCAVGAA